MNKVWVRGIVSSEPRKTIEKGRDVLRFNMRCAYDLDMMSQLIPAELSTYENKKATIPITMYDEMACEHEGVLYEGAYIHEIYGNIHPTFTNYLRIMPSTIDLTGIDDGIEEYQPLNWVELIGYRCAEGWMSPVNEVTPEYRWMIATERGRLSRHVCIKSLGEQALDVQDNHIKSEYVYAAGPIETYRGGMKGRLNYHVVPAKLEWKEHGEKWKWEPYTK